MIVYRKIFLISAVTCLLMTMNRVYGMDTDTVRVTGVVTDERGDLLPSVSIYVKDARDIKLGTTSDKNGKYTISVPENATLRFVYIGCAPMEIVVGRQRIINVVLMEKEEPRRLIRVSELASASDVIARSEASSGDKVPTSLELAEPVDLTAKLRKKAEVDNSFAFKMYREVSKQEGENIFFSPFSLSMALGMLYTGSSGDTRAEMAKVLGMEAFSETDINEYYQKMSQAFLAIDPVTEIAIANAIWYLDIYTVKNTFIETGKKYFDAEVQALDFTNVLAAKIINKWCASKTNNRINAIVSHPMPDSLCMLLTNALYFKSKWHIDKKFDKEKTKWDDFTKTGNQKIKTYLMEQTTSLPYYADGHLQCVELPYGNQAFNMIAILPDESMNINRLIDYLPVVEWQKIVDSMQKQHIWLKLPRFKMECEFPLIQPVMNLGLMQIFEGGFDNISDDSLRVTVIKQKTFVEVNEEGTEAAAVTSISNMLGGRVSGKKPPEPVRFFADRPFLFLICEKSTGVILFIGRIDEPHE